MTIPVEKYWPHVVDGCYFKVYVIGKVEDTNQTFIHEDKFVLIKPEIEIKVMFISIHRIVIFIF